MNRQNRPAATGKENPSCPLDSGEYTGLTALPALTVPAMAYVPFQTDRRVYNASDAFCKGTLFPVLNKPFKGGCAK